MTKNKKSRKDRNMQHPNDNETARAQERTVPIKGMHCASCELLIASELESIPGVTSATASLKTNSATIASNSKIDYDQIVNAVEAAGYEVGEEDGKKPLLTRNERIWKDFLIGLFVVTGLVFLFQVLGLDKILSSATSGGGSNGAMALIIGLYRWILNVHGANRRISTQCRRQSTQKTIQHKRHLKNLNRTYSLTLDEYYRLSC